MRSINFILIGIVLLVLSVNIFAATYNYGPSSSIIFSIEERSVSTGTINANGNYNILLGTCGVSSSSTIVVYYPRLNSPFQDAATLRVGQTVTFKVKESTTNQEIDVTIEITDIDATFTKDCNAWGSCDCENPTNKKVSLRTNIPNTYYCTDPDGNDINNFGTATQKLISSSRSGNNIDLTVGAEQEFQDACSGGQVQERICSSVAGEGVRSDYISCGSGKTCNGGRCIIEIIAIPQCIDTDGGNINQKGSVTRGNTLWDECVDENTVREFSCSGLSRVNTTVACGAGNRCNDGKCVGLALIDFCIDSDNGETLTTKGTTRTGVRNPETLTETEVNEQTDYCFGSNDVVNEYVCDGSNRLLREKPCPAGTACSDGACVAAAATVFCTENDGGREYNIKGTTEVGTKNAAGVIISTELFQDTCTGDKTLKEYYCLGTAKNSVETTCSPNERCYNGACTGGIAIVCTDSDSGIGTSKKGTVEVKQNNVVMTSNTDACVNEKTVNEYSCLGNAQSLSSVACEQGQICKDGACVTSGQENKKALEFSKGWNLFSIPFKNAKVSTTCEGFDLVKKRWYYDSKAKQWAHPVNLEEGKGYWFKTKEDCTVDVSGDSFDISGLELNKGWNQIGSSSQKEEFDSLLASCDVTHGPWGYNTEDKKYEKADKVLVGKGYFVKVSEACKLG